MRIGESDFEKYSLEPMYGRIREYDPQKGYGWIYTEIGKDIRVSSFEFKRKEEYKAHVGKCVRFSLGRFKDQIVAKNIELVSDDGFDNSPIVVGKISIPIKLLRKITYVGGDRIIEEFNLCEKIKETDYESQQFDCVLIKTKKGDYRFFDNMSPIEGDGRVDLKFFFESLKRKLWYM